MMVGRKGWYTLCKEFLRLCNTSHVCFRRGRCFAKEPKCKSHIWDLEHGSPGRRISPSLLFLCLPHRVGGGILEPQTNAFLPWMALLCGNYHSLEIMWRKHFSSQNRKRGICEVQKFPSKYVWASVVRKRCTPKWNCETTET